MVRIGTSVWRWRGGSRRSATPSSTITTCTRRLARRSWLAHAPTRTSPRFLSSYPLLLAPSSLLLLSSPLRFSYLSSFLRLSSSPLLHFSSILCSSPLCFSSVDVHASRNQYDESILFTLAKCTSSD